MADSVLGSGDTVGIHQRGASAWGPHTQQMREKSKNGQSRSDMEASEAGVRRTISEAGGDGR